MCLIGMLILLNRRLFDKRISKTSKFSDTFVLLYLFVQLLLGLVTIPYLGDTPTLGLTSQQNDQKIIKLSLYEISYYPLTFLFYATIATNLISKYIDYLPLFLEYLSLCDVEEAKESLGDSIDIIALIGGHLKKNKSPYKVIFAALEALSKIKVNKFRVAEAIENSPCPPIKAIISIESPNDSFASSTSHKDKYSKNNGK
jgi:hypothetical protein